MEGEKFLWRNTFSLSRIKNIIQSNEKIGKISISIPLMSNRVLEILLIDLFSEIIYFIRKKNLKKIKKKYIKYFQKKLKRFRNFIKLKKESQDFS